MQPTDINHGNQKPQPVSSNDHCLGFSLPSDRSDGTKALGNVVLGPPRVRMGNGTFGQFYGFEVSGHNFSVIGNYVRGVEYAVDITNGNARGVISGNCFEDCTNAPAGNGDSSVKLKLLGRGRPGPMHRFGEEPVENTAFGLSASAINEQTIRFAWTNLPAGAATLTLEVRATGDNSITDTRVGPTRAVPLPATSADIPGYHPGWRVDVRGVAKNAGGTQLGATSWVTVQLPGNPETKPWPPQIVDDNKPPADPLLVTITQKVYASGKVESIEHEGLSPAIRNEETARPPSPTHALLPTCSSGEARPASRLPTAVGQRQRRFALNNNAAGALDRRHCSTGRAPLARGTSRTRRSTACNRLRASHRRGRAPAQRLQLRDRILRCGSRFNVAQCPAGA
jgi:hypothetical protein